MPTVGLLFSESILHLHAMFASTPAPRHATGHVTVMTGKCGNDDRKMWQGLPKHVAGLHVHGYKMLLAIP